MNTPEIFFLYSSFSDSILKVQFMMIVIMMIFFIIIIVFLYIHYISYFQPR